ncbi:MAG: exopolysaccharide biosynthesis polyprenyl glycosylphosphotransferase [Rhodopila sp.]
MTDAVLLLTALGVVCWLRSSDDSFTLGEMLLAGCSSGLASCLVLSRCGAYRLERLSANTPGFGLLVSAVSVGALLFGLSLELLPARLEDKLPHIGLLVGTWAGFALLFLLGAHGLLANLFSSLNLSKALRRRVALVGANDFGRAFIERVELDPESNIEIVGLYTDKWPDVVTVPAAQNAQRNLQDLIAQCHGDDIDIVVLAVSMLETTRIERIRYDLRNVSVDIYVAADIVGMRFGSSDLKAIGRSPIVSVRRRPLDDWQQLQKALFDRLIGGVLLLFLFPPFLLVALIIRLDSSGSIFFRQPRMGFNNRVFVIYKFRTMVDHRDPASLNGARQAKRTDPRITWVGRYLRKYSIDELPQILNVMKGEMSLVGPRPHPLNTSVGNRPFREVVDNYATRHRVLPGITGWAQVNGWRGETVVARQIEQRVIHDLYYIDNWSLALDLRILCLTLTRGFRSENAF